MKKDILRGQIILGLSAIFIICYLLVSFLRNILSGIELKQLKGLINANLLFCANFSVDFILSLPFIIIFSYMFLIKLEKRASLYRQTDEALAIFASLSSLFKNVINTFFWTGAILAFLSCWCIAAYIRSEIIDLTFLSAGRNVQPLINAGANFVICMFILILVIKSLEVFLRLIDAIFDMDITGYIRNLRGK